MPNQFIFANFFATELTTSVLVGSTTLTIPASAALKLQAFSVGGGIVAQLVLWDGANPPEIVQCTANPQNGSLTVVRAQEGTSAFAWSAGTQVISALTAAVVNAALAAYNAGQVLLANYLPLAGGSLSGALILAQDPIAPKEAATKEYVDALGTGPFLALAGGTMTGNIDISGKRLLSLPAPITGSEPATKTYADAISTLVAELYLENSGVGLTTGSGAAYAFTSTIGYAAGIPDGTTLSMRLHVSNRGSPTLAVDGTAAVPLVTQLGVALGPNNFPVGSIIQVVYNSAGAQWIIKSANIFSYITTTGVANTYVLASGDSITLLQDGLELGLIINVANTGACTLNVDGLGATPLRRQTAVELSSGALKQYTALRVRYNAATAEWLVVGPIPTVSGLGDVTLTAPAAGQSLSYTGSGWVNSFLLPRGYIDGATLSNDAGSPNTTLDIAAGVCCADDGSTAITVTAATKTTANFVAGTGGGGLDTGAIAVNTWYAVYAILNPTTGAVDELFSTSFSAPTMPAGFTKKRYIGAFKTAAATTNILAFTQAGDEFIWAAGVVEIANVAPLNTTANTLTLGGVPPGFKNIANMNWSGGASAALLYISSLEQNDVAPSATAAPGISVDVVNTAGGQIRVRTNTSAQIRYRSSNSSANGNLTAVTHSWIDQRGKNS